MCMFAGHLSRCFGEITFTPITPENPAEKHSTCFNRVCLSTVASRRKGILTA